MVWQDHLRRAAVADRQGKGSVGEKSTRYGEDDEHVAKWIVGGDDDGDGERKNDWVGNMKMSLQDARNLASGSLRTRHVGQVSHVLPYNKSIIYLIALQYRISSTD